MNGTERMLSKRFQLRLCIGIFSYHKPDITSFRFRRLRLLLRNRKSRTQNGGLHPINVACKMSTLKEASIP